MSSKLTGNRRRSSRPRVERRQLCGLQLRNRRNHRSIVDNHAGPHANRDRGTRRIVANCIELVRAEDHAANHRQLGSAAASSAPWPASHAPVVRIEKPACVTVLAYDRIARRAPIPLLDSGRLWRNGRDSILRSVQIRPHLVQRKWLGSLHAPMN